MILKEGNGQLIARRVSIAGWGGLFGLMLRSINEDEALLFKLGKNGRPIVHTFFLRFPIDLVFLDEGMRVLEVKTHLAPWRIYLPGLSPAYLVELPAGRTTSCGLRPGSLVVLEEPHDQQSEKVIFGK
jgi:uncharacterized membrane protein (UPF0127 family)